MADKDSQDSSNSPVWLWVLIGAGAAFPICLLGAMLWPANQKTLPTEQPNEAKVAADTVRKSTKSAPGRAKPAEIEDVVDSEYSSQRTGKLIHADVLFGTKDELMATVGLLFLGEDADRVVVNSIRSGASHAISDNTEVEHVRDLAEPLLHNRYVEVRVLSGPLAGTNGFIARSSVNWK